MKGGPQIGRKERRSCTKKGKRKWLAIESIDYFSGAKSKSIRGKGRGKGAQSR